MDLIEVGGTADWGPPARPRPPAEQLIVEWSAPGKVRRRPFQPTPPPPAPPPRRPGPARRPTGRRRSRAVLELAAGALLVAGLAAAFSAPPPRPLTPDQAWNLRAAGPISALAADVAGALSWQPSAPAGNRLAGNRLAADLARVRQIGPPPGGPADEAWRRAVSDVSASLAATGPAARQLLSQAGLELVTVAVDTRT